MKTTITTALLLGIATSAFGGDLPDAPSAHQPTPKFWDKQQITLTIANAGLGTYDAVQTCQNLARGGHEDWNPTQSCGANVGLIAAGKLAVVGIDYLLYKHDRRDLVPWVNWISIAGTSAALMYSAKNRR